MVIFLSFFVNLRLFRTKTCFAWSLKCTPKLVHKLKVFVAYFLTQNILQYLHNTIFCSISKRCTSNFCTNKYELVNVTQMDSLLFRLCFEWAKKLLIFYDNWFCFSSFVFRICFKRCPIWVNLIKNRYTVHL